MEDRKPRYLVTLVHGTWGRGFFERPVNPNSPRWFEENSTFRRELEANLKKESVDHEIQAFTWSGRNSVKARDVAAADLAKQVAAQPQFEKHLVIAHSHGGNVATRALAHLIGSTASVELVTLSTPFIKLFESAGIGKRFDGHRSLGMIICLLSGFAAWWACTMALRNSIDMEHPYAVGIIWTVGLISNLFGLTGGIFLSGAVNFFTEPHGFQVRRKQTRSSLLVEATRYPQYSKNLDRMLVLRGIDDEATLALAFGALLAWISGLMFRVAGRMGGPMVRLCQGLLIWTLVPLTWQERAMQFVSGYGITISLGIYGLLSMLAFMFVSILLICLGKGFFGFELLRGSVRIDVESGNAPNIATNLTIHTLRPDLSLQSRGRHFIYNNEGCMLAIISWLVDHRVVSKLKYDPRTINNQARYASLEFDR